MSCRSNRKDLKVITLQEELKQDETMWGFFWKLSLDETAASGKEKPHIDGGCKVKACPGVSAHCEYRMPLSSSQY